MNADIIKIPLLPTPSKKLPRTNSVTLQGTASQTIAFSVLIALTKFISSVISTVTRFTKENIVEKDTPH